MDKSSLNQATTLYVQLDDGSQVRCVLSHMSESLPTPHESNLERELMVDELLEFSDKMANCDFAPESYIPLD